MNAHAKMQPVDDWAVIRAKHDRQLKILRRRSKELAERVRSGELQLRDAVDVAYDSAESAGLLGPSSYVLPGNFLITAADLVQLVLAECFADARPA
jgi:hypothetical protein